MSETRLLSALANLCNLPKEKINFGFANAAAIQPPDSDLVTAEHNLCKWIEESCEKILKDVIPETFWTDHDLSKPSKVSQLCPDKVNDSVVVLLVVLWSWCSPKCYREITVCLKYGAKNWQTDDMFKPIDWLRTYVKSIWVCVVYSSREIRIQAEKENVLVIAKRTVLIDAYALSQAVSNSSEWFGILTSEQVPILIFRIFVNHYVSDRKLKAKFTGSVKDLSVFSENDRKVVTYWSIATWFKRTVILPPLVEMMTLAPMAELVKVIKTLRYTTDERTLHVSTATYRKASEQAAQKLGLDLSGKENPVHGMLAVFAELAQQIIEKKPKPVIIDNEKLVLKILCPVLLDAAINRKSGIILLKEMMTKKPPLFPDDFVKAVSNNVTCHFDPIDNAKEKVSSKTEAKNLSTKNAPTKKASTKNTPTEVPTKKTLQTKTMMGTPTREKPKEGKSIQEEGKPTAEKLPNGVNREETATTVQVSKRDKTSKKRKNTLSHDKSKSIRTTDGKNARTYEEEKENFTQTQLVNKTEGVEEYIEPKRVSKKTPLFQLGIAPQESSPFKTTLIGFSRPKKTTQRRTTSPNVLSSDTSKEHDHEWDKKETLGMKKIRVILKYFSEDGETNCYRERWDRCEKISQTHSQLFESSKRKGRKIEQDLVVLYLTLISLDKVFRVDKMGQTPKQPNQLENKTFQEIDKLMTSFDLESYHIGEILSHLIASFKPLQSQAYVEQFIQKDQPKP